MSWAASTAFSCGPLSNLASNDLIARKSGSWLGADVPVFFFRVRGGRFGMLDSRWMAARKRNSCLCARQHSRAYANVSENTRVAAKFCVGGGGGGPGIEPSLTAEGASERGDIHPSAYFIRRHMSPSSPRPTTYTSEKESLFTSAFRESGFCRLRHRSAASVCISGSTSISRISA